jgi:hypothetical protein
MTAADEHRERRLYVSWRASVGSIHPIGLLIRRWGHDGERFVFTYLKAAELLADPEGFRPLPGLPELHRRYESPTLFPVFANRVMPRTRPDFDLLARRVDIEGEADPFEVMVRSGGLRQTDRIEVFAGPEHTADDRSSCLFFARGIRHVPGAAEAVDDLTVGDELRLAADQRNQFNQRALRLLVSDGRPVGYAPDYLVEHVHELTDLNAVPPHITVEHVNDATAAPHLRLLCRLDAPWPPNYVAFSDARFQPLVPVD